MQLLDTPGVARILGVSRARVAELMAEHPGFPPAGFPAPKLVAAGNRVWEEDWIFRWADLYPDQEQRGDRPELPVYGRLSPVAERLHPLARDQARALNHPCVRPDHLVLAMLRSDCGGAARAVLESLRLSADELEKDLVDSMGDPFEASELEPKEPLGARFRERLQGELMDGGANRALRLANLKGAELQDEVVASEHILLALADWWCPLLKMRGIDEAALRPRVLAITEGTANPTELAAATLPPTRRVERYAGPKLARSPEGRDPWRRRPWGAILIHDADGNPIKRDGRWLNYFIDRDGHPVLSTNGEPIRPAMKDGEALRDENGDRIHEAFKLPAGVTLKSHLRDLLTLG